MFSQTSFFHLGLCGFLGLMLTVLSGCNPELSEVCSGKYDRDIVDVVSQLEPRVKPQGPMRSAASVVLAAEAQLGSSMSSGSSASLSELTEDEREHWQAWSQSELKRVEAYLDWANLHREESPEGEKTRRRLTDVANRLVAFHGYAQEGRIERMLSTLRAMESDRQEIQAVVCKGR